MRAGGALLPILLGIGATMYQRHTQQALWELGIPHKQTTQLLNELSRLAGQKAAELVRRRRASGGRLRSGGEHSGAGALGRTLP
jgi:hypothetical protein